MLTPLTHRSATELARLIRDRAVSATEVMDAHLEAVERLNPLLNAIVAVAAVVESALGGWLPQADAG